MFVSADKMDLGGILLNVRPINLQISNLRINSFKRLVGYYSIIVTILIKQQCISYFDDYYFQYSFLEAYTSKAWVGYSPNSIYYQIIKKTKMRSCNNLGVN